MTDEPKPTRRECFEKAAPHLARLMAAHAEQPKQEEPDAGLVDEAPR